MGDPDRVLACQLLHACHALYAVDAGGFKASPWFPGAGFVAEPVFVEKGPKRIHAFIAGAHAAGVVVAFRGTLLPDPKGPLDRILRDWINDFNLALAPVAGLPGKVHAGVGEGHSLLLPELLAAVRSLASANRPVIVTGHSKGGLLAAYAAVALRGAGIPVASVYRFGSARVGNRAFADACDAAVPAHWRFEARNDVVVHLPLRLGLAPIARMVGANPVHEFLEDYEQVGELRYIRPDGTIVPDSPALEASRDAELLKAFGSGNLDFIYDDHFLPRGYKPAICGGPPDVP